MLLLLGHGTASTPTLELPQFESGFLDLLNTHDIYIHSPNLGRYNTIGFVNGAVAFRSRVSASSNYTILYYTILYCTVLYYTILYYTILSEAGIAPHRLPDGVETNGVFTEVP